MTSMRWSALGCGVWLALLGAGQVLGSTPRGLPPDAEQRPPIKAFWAKRVTGYLTTRDGTRLRYSALLPNEEGRHPVIVNYSGYDPGSIGGSAYLGGGKTMASTTMSSTLDQALVEHGYAVVGVNARGTGCSEGVFDFTGSAYGADGRDAVEFIAAQSWSDGRVGMANWSWAGISQLATAIERPPHLKAIAPGMTVGDARLDQTAPGGVAEPDFSANWWDFIQSRWLYVLASAKSEGDSACLAQVEANFQSFNNGMTLATGLLRHPLRDATVESGLGHLVGRTKNIEVPVLSMEAFQDEAVSSREGYYQETLRPEKTWMVQTNGPHDVYESLVFQQTLLAFFEHFVKDVANGFEQRPHVEVWLETGSSAPSGHPYFERVTPRFVFHRDSLPVKVEARGFGLSSAGRLVEAGSGAGPGDTYDYPVPGPTVDTEFFNDAWGPMPGNWRRGALAYTSGPLRETFVAYGSASADLWISSTASDTDLQVTLTELRPDGREVYIQRGWLRLSDRALDASASTPVRPVLLDTQEGVVALVRGEPVLARVELNKFSHPFRAGSRIRLWIDAPSHTGEYGFNVISTRSRNTIWHDAGHASRLVLGVLTDVSPPPTRAECGSMLKEPCRFDPLAWSPTHRER